MKKERCPNLNRRHRQWLGLTHATELNAMADTVKTLSEKSSRSVLNRAWYLIHRPLLTRQSNRFTRSGETDSRVKSIIHCQCALHNMEMDLLAEQH